MKNFKEWLLEAKANNQVYDYNFVLNQSSSTKRSPDDIEVIADKNMNFAAFDTKGASVMIRKDKFESNGVTELGFFKIMKDVEEKNPNSPYLKILVDEIPSFSIWWKNSNQKYKSYLKLKKFGL